MEIFFVVTAGRGDGTGVSRCRGPASAGSRGTLRMNSVGERKRGRERERETRLGVCSSLENSLFFFTVAFIF